MPVVWRYLLSRYFQVFLLCVTSFIAVLLVLRFQEIARFAASGAPAGQVVVFILFQIPHILPLAIPISCLIAAILLFQRLSSANELTAFRTSGLSLKLIILPIVFASFLLSLLNLTIICEVAPRCRVLSKELVYKTIATNPLLLFQKGGLVKLKAAHIDIKRLQPNQFAEDILLASKNTSNERLTLLVAKELTLKKELLQGRQVTLISSVDSKLPDGFDHLIIENQSEMNTEATNLSPLLQSEDWHLSDEAHTLPMILAKGFPLKTSAQLELSRRASLGAATCTFTLIGVAFGIQIGRHRSKSKIFYAIGLVTFYMICFITAKSLRHYPSLSMLLYILPHPLILFASFRPLQSVTRGME